MTTVTFAVTVTQDDGSYAIWYSTVAARPYSDLVTEANELVRRIAESDQALRRQTQELRRIYRMPTEGGL